MRTTKFPKRLLAAGLVLGAACAALADSTVSDVSLQQTKESRLVTVTYRLTGDDAIVTVDLLKDGVSLGESRLTTLSGDVNRLIAASDTATRQICWHPDIDWPGQRRQPLVAKVTAWATNAPPAYMVVDLSDKSREYYTSEAALPLGGLSNDVYRTQKVVFRKIPARGVTWRMGSPAGELGRYDDEVPHLVTLTKDYYLGVFELTQGQYEFAAGEKFSSFFSNLTCYATRPIEGVGSRMLRNTSSFFPTAGYDSLTTGTIVEKMRTKSGVKVDLPTEAQWEYACRAGTGTALSSGRNLTNVDSCPNVAELGRYYKNAGLSDDASDTAAIRESDDTVGTARVGSYPANAWGLYDMHGNVAEYCLDEYGEYDGDMAAALVDPVGPKAGTGQGTQVARGGGWSYYKNRAEASSCRSAMRRPVAWSWNKTGQFRAYGLRLCVIVE